MKAEDWIPISELPKTGGSFVVYCPGQHRKVQVADYAIDGNKNPIAVIGGAFHFDLKPEQMPTHFQYMEGPLGDDLSTKGKGNE